MSRQKPRRPRWLPIVNGMAYVQDQSSKMHPTEIDKITHALTVAAKAVREGVATQRQWAIVAGSVDLAQAIERLRVVRGLHEHLTSVDDALKSIHARTMATGHWKPTALHYFEIDAIQAFIGLHAFQLRQISIFEYRRAIASAKASIRGSGGHVLTAEVQENSGAPA